MSETEPEAGVAPPEEVVEAVGVDAALLRSADVTLVVAQQTGDAPVVELEITRSSGETHRVPVPERFVDLEYGAVRLTDLVAWLGVEPDESPDSMRDGYGGLLALARKYFVPIGDKDPAKDATVTVVFARPEGPIKGSARQLWVFGLHPLWDPVTRIPLGPLPSGRGRRTATMASEVEKAPPLPDVGDTGAWPDTLEGWLAFVDGRTKVDEGVEAKELRAMFAGYAGDYDPETDPLDPALEEAMRIRGIPGALPPPEGLPDGVRVIGPTRLRSQRPSTESSDTEDQPAPEDLPLVPFENTMFIYDRGRDRAHPTFQPDPEAARKEWLATLEWLKREESISKPQPVLAGLIVPNPDPQLDLEPSWTDGEEVGDVGDASFGAEDVLPLDQRDQDLLNRGCLGWFVDHKGLAAGAAGAFLLVLVVAVILFGGDDSGSDSGSTRSDAAETQEGNDDDVGSVPVGAYADRVCVTLDENLTGPTTGFQAALQASTGAAPPTPEATKALYDNLEAGARALAAGLTATADEAAEWPIPDIDGGEAANQAAAGTYREAASVAAEIADTVAAYDPINATPAETEALGVQLNTLLSQLDVLGTEFADAPEVTAALEHSTVCAEIEGGAGE
jgi:hypothetical protein